MKGLSMALIGSMLAAPIGAFAQGQGPYTIQLVQGKTTLVSEVIQRTPTSLDVDLVSKIGGIRYRYRMTLTPKGTVTALHNRFYKSAQDTTPLQSAVIIFHGDSVHAEISGNVHRVENLTTQAGAIPYINPSMAAIEQFLKRAKIMGGTVDTIPLFAVAGGKTVPVVVTWASADSAVLRLGAVEMHATVSPTGDLLTMTVPAQGTHIVRLEGAHPLPLVKIDYGPPAGAPYTAEDVTVHTPAGLTLTGTLTLPSARKGKVPAIVTITGSGSEDRDERIPLVDGYRPFWQVADTLARRGIATLRLDDRGVNGSDVGPPNPTSADFANDIRAGLAYLHTRPEIDGTRLGLVGHSEGGMIAPMIAATDPSLKGIVLMAGPAYTGRRILAFQQHNAVDNAPGLTPQQRKDALARSAKATDSLAAVSAWLRFFMDYDPVVTARKVHVPVLILQGETDQQVTPEQADTLAAAFKAGGNRDVTMRKFPDTDHLFIADSSGNPMGYTSLTSHVVRPEVLGTLADWLVKHLK